MILFDFYVDRRQVLTMVPRSMILEWIGLHLIDIPTKGGGALSTTAPQTEIQIIAVMELP